MKKLLIALAIFLTGLPLAACAEGKSGSADLPAPPEDIEPLPEQLPEPLPEPLPETEGEERKTSPDDGETENEAPMPEDEGTETHLPETPALAEYALIMADGLNVRAGAGTGFGILGRLEKGVLMPVYGQEAGWIETRYRGKTAYLSGTYCTLFTLEKGGDVIEKIIGEGYLRLGVPYVYGAVRYHDGRGNLLKNFTAEAFDCSSLMQYIFSRGGDVLLDVTTRTQIKQGTHVRKEDIKRGDLLFFTNASRETRTGIERVGHVALYLGGNYILHTASDYAKIEQISPKRWGYFLEARRML